MCLSQPYHALFGIFIPLASATTTTGHFEVSCDGVGIFLAKIDGAPAPGNLVLFSLVDSPLGTMGDRYFGQGNWSDIYILPDGCVPDGKCGSIAHGRVWIDVQDTQDKPPEHISGKYEIKLNDRLLEGTFLATKRYRKRPLRLCM